MDGAHPMETLPPLFINKGVGDTQFWPVDRISYRLCNPSYRFQSFTDWYETQGPLFATYLFFYDLYMFFILFSEHVLYFYFCTLSLLYVLNIFFMFVSVHFTYFSLWTVSLSYVLYSLFIHVVVHFFILFPVHFLYPVYLLFLLSCTCYLFNV